MNELLVNCIIFRKEICLCWNLGLNLCYVACPVKTDN